MTGDQCSTCAADFYLPSGVCDHCNTIDPQWKAPVPELEGSFPLVLYFDTDADRQEFVELIQKAKPGMSTRNL